MPTVHAPAHALHSAALPAHPQPGRSQAQSARASVPAASSPKKPARTLKDVTVKAGDTVYAIARTHHSSVAAIVKANPRVEFRRLLPGTVLHVPTPPAKAAAKASKSPAPAKKSTPKKSAKASAPKAKTPARTTKQITIHPGDSLYVIAKREHVALASLIKANPGVDARRLRAGATLRLPVPATSAAPTAKPAAAKPATKASSTKAAAKPAQYAPKPSHVVRYTGTSAAKLYPAAVVASGDRHRQQLAKANLPTRAQIKQMIEQTAKRYGVNPTLALAIGWQESGHQQSAVSVCDALGTMQVMPSTGTWAGQIIDQKLNLLEAQDNITAGVVTLRYLTQHADNQDQVIGAYYQGLGAVRAHGFYPDTRRYVASVHAHMKRFAP